MTSETAQQADDLQDADETPRQRVRIRYAKEERIKFISHQDEFRAWERALRRAGLPLLYKQGFNPQPHIQFASPLGVGFTGLREPVDITFAPPVPLPELSERLAASLPPGLTVRDLAEVPLKTPALQSQLIGGLRHPSLCRSGRGDRRRAGRRRHRTPYCRAAAGDRDLAGARTQGQTLPLQPAPAHIRTCLSGL